MYKFTCNFCHSDSYSADQDSKLPCPTCGSPKSGKAQPIVNKFDAVGYVRNFCDQIQGKGR